MPLLVLMTAVLIILLGSAPIFMLWGNWRRLSISHVVPISVALFFGVTPITGWLSASPSIKLSIQALPERSLAIAAVGFLLFSCAVLFGVALTRRFRFRGCGIQALIVGVRRITYQQVLLVFALVWALRLYMGVKYGIFFSGSATLSRVSTLPYWLSSAYSLITFLSLLIPVWAVVKLSTVPEPRQRVLPYMLLILEAGFVFTQGRREMAFFAVLLVVSYLFTTTTVRWRMLFAGVAASWLILVVLFPMFLKARYAIDSEKLLDTYSPLLAYYVAADTDLPPGLAASLYRENIANRSLVYLRWSAEIASGQRHIDPMFGQALFSDVLFTVPSILVPKKLGWLWGELAINEHYGIMRGDSPNSIAALGYADFGLAGVLIYGVAFVLLLALGESFSVRRIVRHPVVCTAALLQLLALAFQLEEPFTTIAVVFRNYFVLYSLAAILRRARMNLRPARISTAAPLPAGRDT